MDFSGEATELLRREKMIGEYYQMLVTDSPKQSAMSGYRTDHRSIFIYNCDVDRFEKVQITDAIDNCFRWGADGLPDGDHDYIQKGYGIPSARDVSLRDDPMMCHHGVSVDKAPNGICAWLGDLPSEHFSNADVRDWADSLKQATKHHGGTGVSPTECSTFLKDILNTTTITNYDEHCLTVGAGFTAATRGAVVDPVWGVFNTPDMNEPLISSLQDSWDPSLSSAVLGDSHPQMAYIPQLSEQQILQRFHGGFPEMWKSLVNADDFHDIRASVVDQVKAAPSDSHRLNILKRANGIYEKALTEKAISRRSQLADAGVLDRALMELQAPTKKSRSAAVKETKAFLDKFGSTVQYFQQLNEERPLDGLTLLQEIVRDYIQPLNARDAQEMEARLEAHIESGDALTPQLLDQWKMELTKDSIESNLSKLARALKPAGVQIDGGAARRDRARTNRGGYRTTIQTEIGNTARPAAPLGGASDKRSEEWKARMPTAGDKSLNALFRCMFCHIRLNRTVLQKFAEYDIIIPFGFMLTRPFIRYDMCSGILAQAGSDLGETFMGHADFQLTDDVIHKVHVGHYTFYSKTIIHNDKRYTIAEDIFAAGYKGGEGTRFYKSLEDLSADIHAEAFRASIIAHMVPYRTNQPNAPRIQNPIDITGRLHPTLYQNSDIPELEAEAAMYPGARYVTEKLELKKLTSYASDATEHFL